MPQVLRSGAKTCWRTSCRACSLEYSSSNYSLILTRNGDLYLQYARALNPQRISTVDGVLGQATQPIAAASKDDPGFLGKGRYRRDDLLIDGKTFGTTALGVPSQNIKDLIHSESGFFHCQLPSKAINVWPNLVLTNTTKKYDILNVQ